MSKQQCDHWNTVLGASRLSANPIRCRREMGHDGSHECGSTSWSEQYGERRADGDR